MNEKKRDRLTLVCHFEALARGPFRTTFITLSNDLFIFSLSMIFPASSRISFRFLWACLLCWLLNFSNPTLNINTYGQHQQLRQHHLDVLQLLHISQHTQTSFDLLDILGIKILDEILLFFFFRESGKSFFFSAKRERERVRV